MVENMPYQSGVMENIESNIMSVNDRSLGIPQFLQDQPIRFAIFNCVELYYISDIHLPHKIINKFEKAPLKSKIKSYIKEIIQGLFSEELIKSLMGYKAPLIIFGGDISSSFELSEMFYTEFVKQWKKVHKQFIKQSVYTYEKNIYAVLGNHEFWDFDNIDACYSAYKNLFQSLGINLLENTIFDVGKVLVVGGTGYAGQNNKYNADLGLYKLALSRTQEIEQSQRWVETYNNALNMAKEKSKTLIVITHNPLSDWKQDGEPDRNCIYFSGHTHRNDLYHDEEKNVHIYANNQIGYMNPAVKFKRVYAYGKVNPFISYDDGYHEVKSADYLKFYDYMGENISGNGLVEKQINKNHAKFYLIKHKGYYGFFVISSKAAYICAGGRIKKIGKSRDIKEFDRDFLGIINRYLKILSPYRNAQEKNI